jgi:glycerol uptake facilitator-like aquaporin
MNTKLMAEFFGTALLLAVVTGSGFMGDTLASGNSAVALLGNSIATGAGLYVLITLLAPISGAHFNPVVSLVAWYDKTITTQDFVLYCVSQFFGAIAGVWTIHLIFSLPIIQSSTKARNGIGIWFSELFATLVLLSVIRLGVKYRPTQVPMLVAMTVTAGYWFTSSTFFSNPAVTLARSMTNTFVGITYNDVFGFISAQLVASILFLLIIRLYNNQVNKQTTS